MANMLSIFLIYCYHSPHVTQHHKTNLALFEDSSFSVLVQTHNVNIIERAISVIVAQAELIFVIVDKITL